MINHQVVLNFNKEENKRFLELKNKMGCSAKFLTNRALTVANLTNGSINLAIRNYAVDKDISKYFNKDNSTEYRSKFNYFYNVLINDFNYDFFRTEYKKSTNVWFNNYMQYLSIIVSYSIEHYSERILNLNE